jgi:2-polyprenyl-3-methyl-5-hydroxy-6-metoxy-1,4-benzoquinol methylase
MRPRADTLLVWTGAPCSYGCSTCPIDPALAPAGLQIPALQQGLAALPARTGRLAVLLGGEPFLRPDLLRLIAAIRAAGCAPGIVTTGRPLVYPQLRARLRQAGLAYLRVQFFGFGATHDRATAVPEAFAQALAGLRAWMAEAGAHCDVDVALTIRRRAIETLVPEIADLARTLPSAELQMIIAIDPASYTEAGSAESLHKAVAALASWNDDATRPLLAWEGLPESAAAASVLTIPPLRPAFVAHVPRACCLGPVNADAGALVARREETRANSFNFVRTTTAVPWSATADACTAYGAASGVEPYRHLWLIEDERLVLHVTDTADFAAAEIAQVKDGVSHLFVDRASAGVLDDFTEGMRRVLPDTTCDACPHRTQCGRRFHVVDGPPFAREEAWIANYVAGLRGRVLDVGCGEQLYQNELAPLVRSGTVRYTGLDPDDLSLTRLRAALPEGRFYLGGVEDFRDAPESYDHILCLRSLNHVTDVDEAVACMASLLKPDGELLVVECTPFAMLRRREQVAAADRAPRAGHQHFRNVASEEVLPYARRRALHVLQHYPATLHTTNEWILLLGRTPAAAA